MMEKHGMTDRPPAQAERGEASTKSEQT